jgi:cysteine-rich repeat protein
MGATKQMGFRLATIVFGAVIALVSAGCASGNNTANSVCGNAIIEEGEECDDGAQNSDLQPDHCRRLCTAYRCGDGVIDSNEECDDGNTVDNDGCGSTCLREPGCGDGVLDPSEQCDDGNLINGDGCNFTCQFEFDCGDGVCETDLSETCVLCPADCCPCGDGQCQSGLGETCALCQVDCCPDCGDGVLGATEQCDDGNLADGDGCSAACVDEDGQADCGNGLWEAGEQCDDGNTTDGDGCDAACQREFVCGDATCETANGETCQLCPVDCCPDCGNGVIDPSEQCDTNAQGGLDCTDLCYTGGTLTCTTWCTRDTSTCTGTGPICGDGLAECGEECDDSDLAGQACGDFGFADGTLDCTSSCTLDTSGCGGSLYYSMEDFEGGCPAGWTLSGDWQCGTPSGVGPTAAHSGTLCLGTVISGSYNNGLNYATCTADSPAIALPAGAEPYLSFSLWLDTESGYDGVNVKISTDGGNNFTQLTGVDPPYVGTLDGEEAWYGNQSSAGWQQVTADLAAYAGQNVVLRFAFRSDFSGVDPGAYLDDVAVVQALMIPIVITTDPALPDVMAGDPYAQTIQRTGGSSAATWSIVGGTNHAWLAVDPTTGVLSGTPAPGNTGPVSVTVRVHEPTLPTNIDERTFTFTVLTPDPLAITTAPTLPPAWAVEPYTQTLERTGGTLSAVWSITGGTNHAWLTIDPNTGALSGTPGAGEVGPVSITVHVAEPLFPTNFDEVTFAITVGERIWGEGFESGCPAGWTFGGDWECGTPTSGPNAAYGGANCIATDLAGTYSHNQAWATAVADSPVIDLSTAAAPHVRFQGWVYTEGNTYDGFNLKVSTDCVNYTLVTDVSVPYNLTVNGEDAWGGNQSAQGWREVTADLSAYAGQSVCLRFAFRSDSSGTYAGVYLDEIMIIEGVYVPLQITSTSPLPDADGGGPYSQTVTRTGGSPAAQWSITGGTNHTWLAIDPSTGELTGTPGPSDLGAVSVTLRVEEPTLPSNYDEQTFTFTVVAPSQLSITTTSPLYDAFVGEPYAQILQWSGGGSGAQWSITGGTNHAWLAIDPNTGALSGTPGAGEVGPVSITLQVAEPLFPTNFDEATFAITVSERIWGEGFESGCPAGWTFGGDWECGTPTSGPNAAYGGANCIATDLAGPYSNSQAWATAVADSPVIDLSTAAAPHVRFHGWVDTEGSTYDGFNLKVSTDCVNYTLVTDVSVPYNLTVNGEDAWGGNQSAQGWREVTADLSAYAGQSVCLRFAFRSDSSGTYAGVYIDEVMIIEGLNIPIQITSTSPLPDAKVNAPYAHTLTRTGGSPAAQWSIVGGTNHAWLSIDPNTGELTGTPAPGDSGAGSVTVHVEEPTLPSNFDEQIFTFTVITEVWAESFESGCPAGWTLGGDWQCGTPTYGPSGAYDGSNCIGTILTGSYSNNQSWSGCVADSPTINLTGTSAPQLRFRLWFYTEGSSFDGVNVKVSTDCSSYSVLSTDKSYNATVDGESAWNGDESASGWQFVTADLTAFAGQTICLRFAFRSDSLFTYAGPYLDAIQIVD